MAQNIYNDGNLVVSEILAQEVGLKLAERGFFHAHPAIQYAGAAMGSSVTKVDYIDAGAGTLASTNENTAVAGTAFTFTRASVTIAQHRLARSVSDMLRFLDSTGTVTNVEDFAADAAGSYAKTLSSLLITAAQSATASVGTSGSDMTWADFRAAKAALVAANAEVTPGSVVCVLHPTQFADLETNAAAAGIGDAVARSPEAQEVMQANAPLSGYRGRYFGVDVFTNTLIPTANSGADYSGFMAARTGLVWADALIEASLAGEREILVDGGRLQIDFDRDSSKAMTNVYYQALVGASLGQDAAVVKMVTSAT
jgi:hypothetical protein|tara:strand:- start:7163 stop:8098 length:936 start_codon:yes stop_codon:yes gene_type:complete